MGRFKRKNRSERVEEILAAALIVFNDKGFRNTTMEDLINSTSLSKGGFYHYFKSTDDIMLAIMESETEIAYDLMLKDLSNLNSDEFILYFAKAMIDRITRENTSKRLFIMFFFEMVYKPEFMDKYFAIEKETLDRVRTDATPFAKYFKCMVKDERMIFLTRLNTGIILFYHIFPGKKMMKKYLYFVEDMFIRILRDIIGDL